MANTTDIVNRLFCKQNSRFCWCAKCSEEPGHQPYIQKQYSSQSANCTRRGHLLFTECNKLPRPCFIQTLSYCLQTFFRDFLSGCDGCVMSRLFFTAESADTSVASARGASLHWIYVRDTRRCCSATFSNCKFCPVQSDLWEKEQQHKASRQSKPLSCNVLNYVLWMSTMCYETSNRFLHVFAIVHVPCGV